MPTSVPSLVLQAMPNTPNTSGVMNELQCGTAINHAIHEHRRADFGLLLALLSPDAREFVATEAVASHDVSEELLRSQLGAGPHQALTSAHETFEMSATIADQFHQGGLASAKLQYYTRPDAIACTPQYTHGLDESVYHNLSNHAKRQLEQEVIPATPLHDTLYLQLIENRRYSQIKPSGAQAIL